MGGGHFGGDGYVYGVGFTGVYLQETHPVVYVKHAHFLYTNLASIKRLIKQTKEKEVRILEA